MNTTITDQLRRVGQREPPLVVLVAAPEHAERPEQAGAHRGVIRRRGQLESHL